MHIVVVTGMSGSGKSTALRTLEDLGFYAIDNLPIRLLDKVVELFRGSTGEVDRLALVVDARAAHLPGDPAGTGDLPEIPQVLARTRQAGHKVDLVYLSAASDILERRYSETRRRHPLSTDGSVRQGIQAEAALLESLRQAATLTLDTSQMSVHELRRTFEDLFSTQSRAEAMAITLISFGFKNGLPTEADLVLDLRFLPNPYFVETLRPYSGLDDRVARYVLEREECQRFIEHSMRLFEFLVPQYQKEGKAYLSIALGCTGGRHRSVAITEKMAILFREKGWQVRVRHRDTVDTVTAT